MADNRVDYSRIKYPLQIVAKKTSSVNESVKNYSTFSVEAAFSPPDVAPSNPNARADSPLEGFDSKFSRFKVSIIHKVERNGKPAGVTYPDGSIRVDELAGIKARSDAALQNELLMQTNWGKNITNTLSSNSKKLDNITAAFGKMGKFLMALPRMIKNGAAIQAQSQHQTQQASSIDVAGLKAKATSVTFITGYLKDKNPLQVILEDPEKGKINLEKHRDFLSKNLAKYPKNQTQIDAINAALTLLASGSLKDSSGEEIVPSNISNNLGSVELYTATPRALIRKKDADTNLCPVYEVSIVWHYGNRYPIEITVINEMAPVNQKDGGQINPVLSQKQNVVKESFRMSIEDWYDVLDKMVDVQKNFKQMYFSALYKVALAANESNRKAVNTSSAE